MSITCSRIIRPRKDESFSPSANAPVTPPGGRIAASENSRGRATIRFATITLCSALALAGCATAVPVTLPGGRQGFVIEDCGSMSDCYKKAAESCPGGKYALIDKSNETNQVLTGSEGTINATTNTEYQLTIVCE